MYEQLYSPENLLSAFKKAKKGKTKKHYVIKFEKNLKENILKLQQELINQTYKPKPLETFILRDPKTRKISKSRFRDRVVHHALINIIKSLFQPSFIYDSHANQIGKGTLKAIQRFDYFKRKVSKNNTRICYILKADIKHYFEEVDHNTLISIIRRKVSDERIIWLIKQILANYPEEGGGRTACGMPLGSHTSQFFANIYLNELDQYVKHVLRAKYYIRYVDDFVILSHSRDEVEKWKEKINEFLKQKLSLELHPQKSQVVCINQGINFLGFRIFYYHKLLRKSNLKKFDSKMKELKILYNEKQIKRWEIVDKLEGWMAYAEQGRQFNKSFPIRHKNQIIRNKKIKNFYRKVYASKVEFSVQKTLLLFRKGLNISQIAETRNIKEDTVWAHFSNLIEHGQLAVWNIIPKNKIVRILQRIKNPFETLKEIKQRILEKNITFNEIECVRAHLIMKEKIKNSYLRKETLSKNTTSFKNKLFI